MRVVDAVQYDRRRLTYDYDMIEYRWDQSLSPGNEQAFYWGSAAADADGTRNYMGVKSAAIDAMIAEMLEARQRDQFVAATRALDRVLMSGFYVVPLYHLPAQWVARWTTIAHPAETSLFGYLPETWWRTSRRKAKSAPDDPRREAENLAAATLDDLFRRTAARRPDAIALTDPPNRESFTDGPPRRLTFAQADCAIDAIASRLRQIGLPTDSFVGIALPNTVESVLTILGVLRAGMIAAPLPLLWRRTETADALGRIGAKAIVTAARVGDFGASAMAVQVASDLFPFAMSAVSAATCPTASLRSTRAGRPSASSPAQGRARRQPGLPCRAGDIRRHPRGIVAVARNHADDRRRPRRVLEGGIGRTPVCSALWPPVRLPVWPDPDALAPERRHAIPASWLRCRCLHRAMPRRAVRHRGGARRTGAATAEAPDCSPMTDSGMCLRPGAPRSGS